MLIDQVKFDYISYLPRISEFYNLRFPRPLVVNLFFYSFILFLINLNNKEIYNNKNFIILGTILALSFTSFYYIFIIEVITFFSNKFTSHYWIEIIMSNNKYQDTDPQETQEWIESLRSILETSGIKRTHFILKKLI